MIIAAALLIAAPVILQDADVGARRAAYSGCLRKFADQSASDKVKPEQFEADLSKQCTAEAEAYKQAMLRSDKRYGVKPSETVQMFEEEVAGFRETFTARFQTLTTSKPE